MTINYTSGNDIIIPTNNTTYRGLDGDDIYIISQATPASESEFLFPFFNIFFDNINESKDNFITSNGTSIAFLVASFIRLFLTKIF